MGRGQPRPADGDNDGVAAPDIGSFETQKFVVQNANDSGAGSLRKAISDNNLAGGGFIRFNISGLLNSSLQMRVSAPTVTISACCRRSLSR